MTERSINRFGPKITSFNWFFVVQFPVALNLESRQLVVVMVCQIWPKNWTGLLNTNLLLLTKSIIAMDRDC